MLVYEDTKYHEQILEFAKRNGLEQQLQSRLTYLETYGCNEKTRCRLFRDFAPYSYYFVMEKMEGDEYIKWFNGGLIYFGDGDSGSGDPQYTVRLGDNKAGWSIHT